MVEFSQGLILPTKEPGASKSDSSSGTAKPAPTVTTTNGTKNDQVNSSAKITTKKLILNEEFKCRADELYRTFVDINVGLNFKNNLINVPSISYLIYLK